MPHPKMQLAEYIGKGGTFNKLIRWWTGSQVSHVELIIDGVWYTSSHTDGGVRTRELRGDSGNWKFTEIPDSYSKVIALAVFDFAKGSKYDWCGIALSQVLPFGFQCANRYFCSELVGEMLALKDSQLLAPHEIKKEILKKR